VFEGAVLSKDLSFLNKVFSSHFEFLHNHMNFKEFFLKKRPGSTKNKKRK
jgi:hypothetical protein